MAECLANAVGICDEGPLEIPWINHVEEALTCVEFGFSMIERVLGNFNDGEVGFRELNHMPAIMLDPAMPWIVKDGKLIGVKQAMQFRNSKENVSNAVDYRRILHFQYQTRNHQPDGESALSGIWILWHNRTSLEELERIAIEQNTSGIPVVYMPDSATAEQKERGSRPNKQSSDGTSERLGIRRTQGRNNPSCSWHGLNFT